MSLQPAHVAANEQHVLLRLGGGRGPSSAARRCTFCRARRPRRYVERLADDRVIDGDAGVQQRQRAERGDAAIVAGHLGPAAARQLLALEIGDAALDGGEDLGGIDRPACAAAEQVPKAGATTATIDNGRERAISARRILIGIPSRAAWQRLCK